MPNYIQKTITSKDFIEKTNWFSQGYVSSTINSGVLNYLGHRGLI